MTMDELLAEIRLTNSILKAAYRGAIKSLADDVDGEPIGRAVVDFLSSEGTKSAGEVKAAVEKSVPSVSQRTVERRIAALEDLGVIVRHGAGRTVRYSLTGLLS